MTRYEYIKVFAPVLLIMAREGITPSDAVYIEAYEQCREMASNGAEQGEINRIILMKYNIPPKKLQAIREHFLKSMNL
ncbi:MAG: hypothetical protein J6S05_08335 [Bacteroidaceae bacterium]|nr:hypothetical protein [Bacteroidaceae bacterium]